MQVIKIDPEKCRLCYSCIRACPANAITTTDVSAVIDPGRCVACGSCLKVCPYGAISYSRSGDDVAALIAAGDEVAAICDPSISGEFSDITNYTNFVGMIKALGFKYVCEASFGADIVALKYRDLFANFRGKYFITASCPAMVGFVERYHPGLVDNLAPLVSPAVAMAQIVRKRYGDGVKVVYIGPCTALKRYEHRDAVAARRIDHVLTFAELRAMFRRAGVTENNVEFSEFDPPIGGKGSLFPVSRGMFQSVGIDEDLMSGQLICADGRANALRALAEFESFPQLKQHLDLFYCDGNCIMGPGTTPGGHKFLRRSLVISYAIKRQKTWDKEQWDRDIQEFLPLDYTRSFQKRDMVLGTPSDPQLNEILRGIGREGVGKDNGCGGCGYDSCRELAKAIYNGVASPDACHAQVVQRKNEYRKQLDQAKADLDASRQALEQAEREIHTKAEALNEAGAVAAEMLHHLSPAVVVTDAEGKITLSNPNFVKLMGPDAQEIDEVIPGLVGADLSTLVDESLHSIFQYVQKTGNEVKNKDIYIDTTPLSITVFPVVPGKTTAAIIRDLKRATLQDDEVVGRIEEAIGKNLQLVQEIAFILGEGAAETEQILRSVTNSYSNRELASPSK